jgi:hypothetical protein
VSPCPATQAQSSEHEARGVPVLVAHVVVRQVAVALLGPEYERTCCAPEEQPRPLRERRRVVAPSGPHGRPSGAPRSRRILAAIHLKPVRVSITLTPCPGRSRPGAGRDEGLDDAGVLRACPGIHPSSLYLRRRYSAMREPIWLPVSSSIFPDGPARPPPSGRSPGRSPSRRRTSCVPRSRRH